MKYLCLLFIVLSCAHQDYRIKNPFLYRVQKNGEKAYLFGTMHVGIKSKDLPAGFWRYLKKADAFVAEVDMIKDAALIEKRINERMLRGFDEPTLHEQLPAQTSEQLLAVFEADYPGRGKNILERASLVGALAYLQERNGKLTSVYSEQEVFDQLNRLGENLDQELTEQAMVLRKPVHTLDDLLSREFISCVLSIKYGVASEYPKKIHALLTHQQKAINLDPLLFMMNAYRNGNERFLRQMSVDSSCALADRNVAWVVKIKNLMLQYKRPLITMGVLHLEHEGSVIELLEDEGYQVDRLELRN